MSNIFFIGCMHFDHNNIIQLADRPFNSVDEMNQVLVDRWNARVGLRDIVYVLGDFAWKRPAEWMSRLHGHKYVLIGNHDNPNQLRAIPGLQGVTDYQTISSTVCPIVLFHYPIEDWEGRFRGSIHLHAHTHSKKFYNANLPWNVDGTRPVKFPVLMRCNRFNVCAEAIDYTPVSLDEIISASHNHGPA